MFAAVLLLMCGAVLAGSLVTDDISEEEVESSQESEEEDAPPPPVDISTLISDPIDEPVEPVTEEPSDEGDGTVEVFVSPDTIDDLPSPLSDWAGDGEVHVLTAGENETVFFEFPEDVQGSIMVSEADYLEMQDDSSSPAIHEHTGLNVYFIPEGVEFPQDYSWSEEGATFYNTETGVDDEQDFEGIRLLARIDSGSWGAGTDEHGDIVLTFDNRIGDPDIVSNVNVVFV